MKKVCLLPSLVKPSCLSDLSVFRADRSVDPPRLGIGGSGRCFEYRFNRGVRRGKVGRIFEGALLGGVHLHDQHGGGRRSKVTVRIQVNESTTKETISSVGDTRFVAWCSLLVGSM